MNDATWIVIVWFVWGIFLALVIGSWIGGRR
jgi:hypothetical protein